MKGFKMSVYIGIGSDPLWQMGPAFIGMQDDNRAAQKAAKAKKEFKPTKDLAASWETIPPPTSRKLKMTPVTTYSPQAAAAAANPATPEGILTKLIAWLSS